MLTAWLFETLHVLGSLWAMLRPKSASQLNINSVRSKYKLWFLWHGILQFKIKCIITYRNFNIRTRRNIRVISSAWTIHNRSLSTGTQAKTVAIIIICEHIEFRIAFTDRRVTGWILKWEWEGDKEKSFILYLNRQFTEIHAPTSALKLYSGRHWYFVPKPLRHMQNSEVSDSFKVG